MMLIMTLVIDVNNIVGGGDDATTTTAPMPMAGIDQNQATTTQGRQQSPCCANQRGLEQQQQQTGGLMRRIGHITCRDWRIGRLILPMILRCTLLLWLVIHVGSFSACCWRGMPALRSSWLGGTARTATRIKQQKPQARSPLLDSVSSPSSSSSSLFSGRGVARDYSWHEEAFELEVTVPLPINITVSAKDIFFKATTRSIDLRCVIGGKQQEEIVLLDPKRKLRGRVDVDGTFWVFSDGTMADAINADGDDSNGNGVDHSMSHIQQQRQAVVVTIEKLHRTPVDDFDVMEYDWKGLFVDDQDEVSYRHYDEPEALNVRQYAHTLGVDIDNINMSMVDKSMFGTQLNLTKRSLDQMVQQGYLQRDAAADSAAARSNRYDEDDDYDNDDNEEEEERHHESFLEVTQQADGQEFTVNADGEPVPYSILDPALPQQLQDGAKMNRNKKSSVESSVDATTTATMIPLLDTNSQWHSVNASSASNRSAITVAATATTANVTTAVSQPAANAEAATDTHMGRSNIVETTYPSTTTSPIASSPPPGVHQQVRNFTQAAYAAMASSPPPPDLSGDPSSFSSYSSSSSSLSKAVDPIDVLPLSRLQAILSSQGLSGEGSIKELRQRLRERVNGLLQGKQ